MMHNQSKTSLVSALRQDFSSIRMTSYGLFKPRNGDSDPSEVEERRDAIQAMLRNLRDELQNVVYVKGIDSK